MPISQPANYPWPTKPELRLQQSEKLQKLLRSLRCNSFYEKRLQTENQSSGLLGRFEDVTKLPFTTKADFVSDQQVSPPYGSNLSLPIAQYARVHQTSGTSTGQPLRWLDTGESWEWMLECWRQIYGLMGVTADDRFCFAFSFGPFLGFWAGFEGASRLGHFCVAAGGLSSEARLQLIDDHQITVLACTPSYALRLAEVAKQLGKNPATSSVTKLLVAGEPGGSIPTTRALLSEAWGARVFDHWGMTEVGPLASESVACPGELTLLETECIPEIIDPETGQQVEPGTQGELVITNLGRVSSPAIRYRTGDLVVAATTAAPDGCPYLRLAGGVLGRTDDLLNIRGNKILPSAIEGLIREFREVVEYRIVVCEDRAMRHLQIEVESHLSTGDQLAGLIARLASEIKRRFHFEAEVKSVEPNTLPRFEMKAKRLVWK